MQRVNAKQGLLVAWGGFTKDTIQEARNVFFSMRLWDQGVLLNEIIRYYEQFEDELKAELPLKRIWTLVEEEDDTSYSSKTNCNTSSYRDINLGANWLIY
jgi:restriction system protein